MYYVHVHVTRYRLIFTYISMRVQQPPWALSLSFLCQFLQEIHSLCVPDQMYLFQLMPHSLRPLNQVRTKRQLPPKQVIKNSY